MEGADGLVQQRLAPLLRYALVVRRADRRQAVEEDSVGMDLAALHQAREDLQRLVVLPLLDQRPRLGRLRRGGALSAGGAVSAPQAGA